MRIIISPAKNMSFDEGAFPSETTPFFLPQTEELLSFLRKLSLLELKRLLACGDAIAQRTFTQYQTMELNRGLTPALLAYRGIQYTYMAPGVFSSDALAYVQKHLRILSGFYGCLRPLDGVVPYRLEMMAPLSVGTSKNLYTYWGSRLYDAAVDGCTCILNLASKEYAMALRPYSRADVQWIDVTFGERVGEKVVEKGVYVKMARGAMVRFLAENNCTAPEDMRGFQQLGFAYVPGLSTPEHYVFLAEGLSPKKKKRGDKV